MLPSFAEEPHDWPHLRSIQLADPEFLTPRPIDILIGADTYGLIINSGVRKHSPTAPIGQSTIFGWIVLGPINQLSSPEYTSYHVAQETSNQEIQDMLKRFWVQEELPSTNIQPLSPDEKACEDHFTSTHSRDETGRYTVRIPLKSPVTALGESQPKAEQCLTRLLIRLSHNRSYNLLYTSFMTEYHQLGHMIRAPTTTSNQHHQRENATGGRGKGMTLAPGTSVSGGLRVSDALSPTHSHHPVYYLPHHGVLREDSATTKLRVVFNGSSPSSTGVSVNDIQHVGSKVQRDIADILIWIRQYKYLFMTDITKMYRQIQVHPEDWDLQRVMWIDGQNHMVPYQLTTVTYGTRSAPFLAIRTLMQLVQDDGHLYPLAVEPLTKGRYVDDIFGGSDESSRLIDMSHQVTQLCKAGGFPLAKWQSNNKKLMQTIAARTSSLISSASPPSKTYSFEESSTKLLGLSWDPSTDVFTFKSTPLTPRAKLTKRIILSETAQLFDPLGFLSPFVIRAKILLQELWLEKLTWDDTVSETTLTKWDSFREELSQVSDISVPRWLTLTSQSTVELHGFCDASQLAMAAVIYIRTTGPDHHPEVAMVCAKSKVAPLKVISIPRLELSAALLLAKLIQYVQATLEFEHTRTVLWTDSAVTLTWVKSQPSRWKEFGRNRVSIIQELTPHSEWRFIAGKDNPADCASRGVSIAHLKKHPLWWRGPPWLAQDQSSWPAQPLQKEPTSMHQEERPGLVFAVSSQHQDYHWDAIYRYSSLTKLLRATAICFRVSHVIQHQPHATLYYPLTPQDLEKARVFWIKATQAAYFSLETKYIRSHQIPPAHPFTRLTAFIDTQGIIRVGGRLENSSLECEAIHPVILPRESHFTTLVIRYAHEKTMHGGTQSTLNFIRTSYWIIGGRSPVRSYVLRCIKCARQRGVRAQQLMGQLPSARVTPTRPFASSGVDYAGPLTIKTWKGRGATTQKGWLCAFVCFVTSAVHLEAVTEYSSEAFIGAFRRFTSRRGICHTLYSDCGTNFQGADTTLRRLFTQGTEESRTLCCSLTNDGTSWKFNPPAAPHMGGKWEAAVKSVKYHLVRTIGDAKLTYEELSTLLTQIEAILNSRPLEPLTEDPDDISALTPAHFIVGEAIATIPEPTLIDVSQGRLSRWQFIQQRLQYFWSRWSRQYLQRQLSMSKWHHPHNNIAVGSLVLITDERFPPTKWPLARVIELYPGKDGLTRVVSLKTATTTLTRPITKLAILPPTTQ